jgi:hypothetical protein
LAADTSIYQLPLLLLLGGWQLTSIYLLPLLLL